MAVTSHAVRVGPCDAGRRVSLRTRTPDGAATDTVGVLTSWTADGDIAVARRGDSAATLQCRDLVAGVVAAPDWGCFDLQRVAQDGWRPAESTRWRDWELRWSDGVSERANSTRVGADPHTDVEAGLAAVTAWYRARGGRPLLQVPSPSQHDAAFDAAGWAVTRRVRFYAAPTSSLQRIDVDRGDDGVRVTLASTPSPEWVAAMDEPESLRGAYVAILRRSPWAAYATATLGGRLAGIARATVTPGPGRRSRERLAGISSVHVLPHARRRGVATACMAALARWSAEAGAGLTYLQVLDSNPAAIACYESLGFTPHHGYAYRSAHR